MFNCAITMFYVISVEQLHQRLLCLTHVENSSFLLVNIGTVYNHSLKFIRRQSSLESSIYIEGTQEPCERTCV